MKSQNPGRINISKSHPPSSEGLVWGFIDVIDVLYIVISVSGCQFHVLTKIASTAFCQSEQKQSALGEWPAQAVKHLTLHLCFASEMALFSPGIKSLPGPSRQVLVCFLYSLCLFHMSVTFFHWWQPLVWSRVSSLQHKLGKSRMFLGKSRMFFINWQKVIFNF